MRFAKTREEASARLWHLHITPPDVKMSYVIVLIQRITWTTFKRSLVFKTPPTVWLFSTHIT